MKLPKMQYGLWFMSLSFGYMAGNFISGRYAARLGVEVLIYWGNVIGVVGAVLMAGIAMTGHLSMVSLFLPVMMTSMGNGLVLPNALAGGIGVDPRAAGAGSGLMGFGQMGVGAIASYIGGKMTADTALPLAGLMLFFAVFALIAGWFARRA